MRPARLTASFAPRPVALLATCAALALCSALAPLPGRAFAQGIGTSLVPAPDFVAPGATFEVDLEIPVADTTFNGFHAVIGYDPAALTFVPPSPASAALGCLMNGGCSAACGSVFHIWQAAGDSITVDLSLLCDQVQLSGPGQVYRLNFIASDSAQVTYVTTRRVSFYDAGIGVSPGATADSRIVIGSPAAVGGSSAPLAWRVAAIPNPSHGAVALAVTAPADGEQVLDVLDLSGRVVRHLSGGWRPRGARSLTWDGRGADGSRLPAAVYLVRLRAGGNVAATRVTLLP